VYVSRENELERLLDPYAEDTDDEDVESDDSESSEDGDVGNLSCEQLEWIRETAVSGRWLAPTGHWLAHRAQEVLKNVALLQRAGPAVVLECLDKRAAFVRQAHSGSLHPACQDFGEELLEAAQLLLTRDGWADESTFISEREMKARARLEECIEVLEPQLGPQGVPVSEARNLLLKLAADAKVSPSSLAATSCDVTKGLKRQRSPERA
jgi:hypothetical protein